MNIKDNPPRRTALIWSAFISVGIIVIFIPGIIGLDGFDGGFALSILGGFIAMISIIAAIIYFRMAKILDRITQKENNLAHWTYTPKQWKAYTEKEHSEDAATKKGLFLMITIIALLVGIVFYAIVRDNPLVILSSVLGIIAVAGLSAYFSTLSNYRRNKKYLGETYIALDGVYLNRQLHIWKGIGNRLEDIAYDADRPTPRIIIEYSTPSKGGRNSFTARVPVPPGEEETAKKIVDDIARAHLFLKNN